MAKRSSSLSLSLLVTAALYSAKPSGLGNASTVLATSTAFSIVHA